MLHRVGSAQSTSSAYSEVSEYMFQIPPIKTVQNPVRVYIHDFFKPHPFSDFTLNTLKLATFSYPYA